MHAARHKHPVIALLLLAVMCVQTLVSSAEAALEASSLLTEPAHHSAERDHEGPGAGEASSGHAATDAEDNCDHCCQCHGQCSHSAAAAVPAGLVWPIRRVALSPSPAAHISRYSFEIHRPPIA